MGAPASGYSYDNEGAVALGQPQVVNLPAQAVRSRFKIVAFNARGRGHVELIARCFARPPLDDASVIMLSEAAFASRVAARRKFAEELAGSLGMSFAFLPCFTWASKASETPFIGNAILSRQPLGEVRAVATPQAVRPRYKWPLVGSLAALLAEVVLEGRRITLGAVHLDRHHTPAGRVMQMTHLLDSIGREAPAVIAGDLNSVTMRLSTGRDHFVAAMSALWDSRRLRVPQKHEPLFGRLLEAGFELDHANVTGRATYTFSSLVPRFLRPKLDWIAVRGLRVAPGSAAVVAPRLSPGRRRLSDHDFITCELEL